MGHQHTSRLFQTRKWVEIVALLEGGAEAAQIANATTRAAEKRLAQAASDKGMVEAVRLLAQLPNAARAEDLQAALGDLDVHVPAEPTLFDIVAGVTESLDRRLANNHGRTDLGEMAQMALAETLTEIVQDHIGGLFAATAEDVQRALGGLATVKQFGWLARVFFGRVTTKFLASFVHRALPAK